MSFFANKLPTITQPGHLDREVTLYSRTDTPDQLGQSVPSWVSQGNVWAAWEPTGGEEVATVAQLAPLQRGVLRIRYLSTVTSDWRVVMGNVTFEITAPPIEVGRRAFLDLHLQSLNQAIATS